MSTPTSVAMSPLTGGGEEHNEMSSPPPTTVADTSSKKEEKDDKKQEKKQEKDEDKKDRVRLVWTDQTEELLVGWADVAACYKWLHDESFRKYKQINNYFSIPVIILSTLTGTLNLALQGYVPADYMNYAQAGIGGINIFTGILTTLQTQFRYAQNSESHFNVSSGWSKLQRNIAIELSIDREHRREADGFIKAMRTEYDRLLEQSPVIPQDIVYKFKRVFKEQQKRKRKEMLRKHNREMWLKEKEKEEREKTNMKKSTCKNFMNCISAGRLYPELNDREDEFYESGEEVILPDICDSIAHTKVYKGVLNGTDKQIITEYVPPIQGSTYSQGTTNSIIPEIKNALTDRIRDLDEKTAGIQQFKLAMMGDRYGRYYDNLQHVHQITQAPIGMYNHPVQDTVKETQHLSQPVLNSQQPPIKPLGGFHLRRSTVGEENKNTFNPDRRNSHLVLKERDRVQFPDIKNLIKRFQVPDKVEIDETIQNQTNVQTPLSTVSSTLELPNIHSESVNNEKVEIKIVPNESTVPPLDLKDVIQRNQDLSNILNNELQSTPIPSAKKKRTSTPKKFTPTEQKEPEAENLVIRFIDDE